MGPYQNGEHDSKKNWDLQGNWHIFEEGLKKLTDPLADMFQWLREEGCDGNWDCLNRETSLVCNFVKYISVYTHIQNVYWFYSNS